MNGSILRNLSIKQTNMVGNLCRSVLLFSVTFYLSASLGNTRNTENTAIDIFLPIDFYRRNFYMPHIILAFSCTGLNLLLAIMFRFCLSPHQTRQQRFSKKWQMTRDSLKLFTSLFLMVCDNMGRIIIATNKTFYIRHCWRLCVNGQWLFQETFITETHSLSVRNESFL